MDTVPKGELGSQQGVKLGNTARKHKVQNDTYHIGGVGGTCRDIDDRLAFDNIHHTDSISRVGSCSGDTAVGRTASYRYDCRRTLCRSVQMINKGFTLRTDRTKLSIHTQRHSTLYKEKIFPFEVLHRLLHLLLCLMPGSGLQCLMELQRDDIQNDLIDLWSV